MAYRALDKYIAEDFEDPVNRRMEFLRKEIFKDCSHVGVISTDHNLCSEIIGRIGDLNGKDVLVWFNPEFLFLIRDKFPKARIWFVTGSMTANRMGVFGQFGSSIEEVVMVDPYNFESVKTQMKRINMKFDVVVGNPPYQATTDSETGNTQGDFWFKFLKKSVLEHLNENGYLAFITPRSWCGIGGRDKSSFKLSFFKNHNPIWINFDVSDYFDVGITTSAYVLQYGRKGTTEVQNLQGASVLDFSNIDVMPFEVSVMNMKILNKVLTKNGKNRYNFTEGPEKNKNRKKVYVIRARYISTKNIKIDMSGVTSDSWKASMPISDNEVDGAISVFRSRLTMFLFTILGGPAGQSQTGILQNMPYVSLTKKWTDDELYEYFDLDDDEKKYINVWSEANE